MATTKSVTALLKAKDSGFTSVFGKASSALGKLAGNSKPATLGIKSIVGALGIAKVAGMAWNNVVNNMNAAMSRQDTLYLYNRNLKQMGYNAKTVEKNQAQLTDAVTDTAYALDSVANSTQSFANSQIELGKATEYSTRFMDLVSRYGDGTNETYKRVMLQMNQMASKGKANLGDIKSAVEANIPVWAILSKETGKSMGKIQEEISEGEWTSKRFFDTLMKGSQDAAGAAKDGANTWSGAIGIMKSRFALGVGDILTSVKKIATTFTGDEFGIFKVITSFGTFVRSSFAKVGEAMAFGFEFALPYITKFQTVMDKVKPHVTSALNAIKSSLSNLYGQFDKSTSVQNFGSVVEFAGSKIIQFANYVERNADKIAQLIGLLPKLAAGFMALKTVSSVTRTLAGFGAEVTGILATVFDKAHRLDVRWHHNVLNPLLRAINTGKGNVSNLMGVFGLSIRESFDASMATINPNKYTAMFTAIGDGISYTFPKFTKFASVIMHPVASLKTLGVSLAATSAAAGGNGTIIQGAALKIGAGFKKMAATGVAGIKSLTGALLSNPITAALVGITVAVVTVAAAWKNNFMNIQGVVKTFASSVGNSLSSLTGMFSGLEPVIEPVGKALKVVGMIITGTVLVGVAALVDGFRGIVFVATSVVKAVQAVGQGLKGVDKALKLDFDGAKKDFAAAKKSIDSIGEGFDNLKANSALAAIPKAMNEWGESSTNAKAVFMVNLDDMAQGADKFSTKLSEAGNTLKEAFVTDESSDRVKKYYDSALSSLTSYQEERVSLTDRYNQMVASAEGKSAEEQQAIALRASQMIIDDTSLYGDTVLQLHRDLTAQLKSNKNLEGQELTEEQRAAIREQNDVIRQGLMEQNELYVQASLQKLANGQRLSDQEVSAAIANTTALYSNKKEQITSNEEQIKELLEKANESKDELTKQNYQAQAEALRAHNESILAEQQAQGEQLLALLVNGNELNSATVLQGLQGRKDITDEQLGAIFQSFVNSGQNIDQQLFLLGGIMEQRGLDGSNKLVQALKTGDLTLVGSEFTAEMEAGLNGLPSSMFWSGDIGKKQFIQALKSGESPESAGRWLVDSMDKGLQTGEGKGKAAGGKNADAHNTGVEGKKGESNKAGKTVGEAAADGAKSTEGKHREAGTKSGDAYNKGIASKNGSAKIAGTTLANNAKTGASSVDFSSVGASMAEGVAAGIRAGTGSAVSAMASLVNQVNEEAKKVAKVNSPSKLLRDGVGYGIPEGVAVGIKEKTRLAVEQARALISAVYHEMTGNQPIDILGSNGRLIIKSDINSHQDALSSKLDELINTVANLKLAMYINHDALVGEIGPGVNTNLGDKTGYERRYRS